MIGSNVSIFRKGLVLVCLPIGLQLVVLICLLRLQFTADDADRWAVHTKEVIAAAEGSYRVVMEAVAQVRGAIITNNADFTPDLAVASNNALPSIEKLHTLVADNPAQVKRVEAFRNTAQTILDRVHEERERVRSGKSEDAAAMVTRLTAQKNTETLHELLATILSEEQKLDVDRIARVAAIRRQGYWFAGITAVVTVLVAALVLYLFVRNVAQRLALLARNAASLAERRPLAALVEGTDEIGVVDRAFHRAAERLAEADVAESQHREELERRAAELADANAQLARSNGDLRFKTQEIETFVYSVSHDLRSPLVNLQGFSKELARTCEELRSEAAAADVPKQNRDRMLELIDGDIIESVRFIQTAVSRSGNIIDSLLRLSRAGRLDYKHVRVDPDVIVQRVIDAMQSVIREKGAELAALPLPSAEADPTAVEQIFGNLIGNAVNYLNPNRKGRIEIGGQSLPDVNPGGGRQMVRYYVKDNGLGIPEAYLPKMFVAFQRLHGQVARGEGIGLAMVRRMVDRLGGEIWVESKEDVGSTFFFTLPAAEAGEDSDIPAAASGAYSNLFIAKD